MEIMRRSQPERAGASVPLNIRIKPETRNLIDRAAALAGQNRTDFILEASQRRAERLLLDQAMIHVDAQSYAAFLARLDEPTRPDGRLRHTMTAAVPWDEA
jgi:uncharacterized protein (DUF1778 family)